MRSPRDDHQPLVVARKAAERILAEVTRMGLLAVDHQDGAAYLVAVGQKRHVHERQSRCDVPAVVRVERTDMVAARSLVIGVVVLHKLRRILRKRVHDTSRARIAAAARILRTLSIEPLTLGVTAVGIHRIEISVGRNAAHVIHRRTDRSLDTGIYGRGVQGHAAPTAYTQDTDTLRIDIIARREIVDRRTEILRVDIGRGNVAGFAAALTRIRGVERYGQESALGQRLRIQPRRLLLHRPERPANGYGRHRRRGILRHVEIRRKRYTVTVAERNLGMCNLVALREDLVPLARHIQTLHIVVLFSFITGRPTASG